MDERVLCIDVGNSRTKFGLMIGGSAGAGCESPRCRAAFAVAHGQPVPWGKLRQELGDGFRERVHGFIAGSNPEGVAGILHDWPQEWPPPIVLDDVLGFPIEIRLESPNKAGIDRILNAVAANRLRPPSRPAVIVDTGTATTVDVVSSDGAFEGGAILPGFELCARALHQYTALLPFVTIDELIEESHEPLGRNTREALRSGLLWGQIGAVKELIGRLARRWEAPPFLLLTGGGAPLAAPHLSECSWEPHLSLQGLALVAEKLLKDET